MSLRLEMLQAARLAPRLLGESTELVRAFLLGQQNSDGGFKDRLGKSDLYYSVFGIEALLAVSNWSGDSLPPQLQLASQRLESYLRTFGSGEGLDLVHLCCLIRCWADLQVGRVVPSAPPEFKKLALSRLETYRRNLRLDVVQGFPILAGLARGLGGLRRLGKAFRLFWHFRSLGRHAKDGGHNPVPNTNSSIPYGCFLALGAYQDLEAELPNKTALVRCLENLQNENGSWENATNATAAALATLGALHAPVKPSGPDWLLARCHPEGGFLAGPNVPMPDLLSTATALHALAGLGVPLEPIREKCLDFLDSLWTNQGSFHGHWLDETLDCEYTFYALLALGHLS